MRTVSTTRLYESTAANVVLAIALVVLAAAATVSRPVLPESFQPGDSRDVVMYQRIIDNVRDGQPYYSAVGAALRDGHYATREPFNWRTPLLMMSLARLGAAGRPLLIVLTVILCVGTVIVTIRDQPIVKWTAMFMQAGVLATTAIPAAFYLSEAWTGVLIGLSVVAFLHGWRPLAVGLALLALFTRELAAPYCIVCTFLALHDRRWRELAVWTIGALAYAAYYGAHLLQIWAHRLPTDLAHATSWLTLGGLPSVTGKLHFQFWLFVAPFWATALVLVLVVAACLNPRVPLHLRVVVTTYIGFFALAGQIFDTYWGMIAWPTWALAAGFGAQSVYDLLSSFARGRRFLPSPIRG